MRHLRHAACTLSFSYGMEVELGFSASLERQLLHLG